MDESFQDFEADFPWRLAPTTPMSRVELSTTEPLCSLNKAYAASNKGITIFNLFSNTTSMFFLKVEFGLVNQYFSYTCSP